MSIVANVLGDFIQGLGAATVTFLIALPVAIVTRIVYKRPNSLRQGLEIFALYVVVYALVNTVVKPLLINIYTILAIPNLIYLLCVSAFSERATRLWHGSGVMTTFFGAGIALAIVILIRIV